MIETEADFSCLPRALPIRSASGTCKRKILYLLASYRAGHDATGPNQSIRALVQGLGETVSFRVVARMSDDVTTSEMSNGWHYDGLTEVRYCKISKLGAMGLRQILRDTDHDLLVLNSFFDRQFTIPVLIMRRLGMIPARPVILSPRGELAGGALSLKSGRKIAYMKFVNRLGLLKDVWLHATAAHEHGDIARSGLKCRGIIEAPDTSRLPPRPVVSSHPAAVAGKPLRIAFVGRISPVKNLHFALDVLRRLEIPVQFDLFGPIEDTLYWARCTDQINRLPPHVEVKQKGTIANDRVVGTLANYDLFLLPTLGENYGHAIHEALASGLPVLISDKTPWQELEAHKAGWNLPLGNPAAFADKIIQLAAMGRGQRLQLKDGARRLAVRTHEQSNAIARNKTMFLSVIEAGT